MGGLNLQSGYGAGAGADALKDLLKQKFLEQIEARRAAEAQQLFGQNQQRIDQDARQFDVTSGLNAKKFGEDTRQFGITSGQAGERIGMDKEMQPGRIAQMGAQTADLNRQPQEALDTRAFTTARDRTQHGYQMAEEGTRAAHALRIATMRHPDSAGGQTPQQQNEVADSIALLDQIAGDSALDTAVGPLDAYGGKIRDLAGVTRFENLHNQLVGKLQLAQAGKLKGQGQISDKERAMLQQAASALTRNLSEADYKAELMKIRGQFERMQAGKPATTAAQPAKGGGGGGDPLGLRKK